MAVDTTDSSEDSGTPPRQRIARPVVWLGLTGLGIMLIILFFWPLADWLAQHDVSGLSGTARIAGLREARDAARGRFLQLGAGIFAAGALFYTARNFALAREQGERNRQTLMLAEISQRQQAEQTRRTLELTEASQRQQGEQSARTLELTEQGLATDRFAKAVDQLGSSAMEVRIGGIYALERIMTDSVRYYGGRDQSAVTAVLATYVREHSHDSWLERPLPFAPTAPDNKNMQRSRPRNEPPRPDVIAAMKVIGNRNSAHDQYYVDLTGVNLSLAVLNNLDFSDIDFYFGDLSGADFNGTRFVNARLVGTLLTKSSLDGANFEGAEFTHADCKDTDFSRARLSHHALSHANTDERTRFPSNYRE